MILHQLSVFVENQPGQLSLPCRILADAKIPIIGLTLADADQFGILRLIVPHWEQAKALLEKAGCVVKVTEVIAIEAKQVPGGLLEILQPLEEAGINVEYLYAIDDIGESSGAMVLRFEDSAAAIQCLQDHGINTSVIPKLVKELG